MKRIVIDWIRTIFKYNTCGSERPEYSFWITNAEFRTHCKNCGLVSHTGVAHESNFTVVTEEQTIEGGNEICH